MFTIFDVATGITGTAEFAPAFPAFSRAFPPNVGLAVGLQSEMKLAFSLDTMIIGLHKKQNRYIYYDQKKRPLGICNGSLIFLQALSPVLLVGVREVSNIRGKISLILRFLYNLRFVYTCKLNLNVFAKLRSAANHVFISATVTFATFAVNFNFPL